MITRRDLFVALVAVLATAGIYAIADQKPVMGSAVFDWNTIPVKATNVGSVRQFFSAPTATLENLELHVTTLNPGQSPHRMEACGARLGDLERVESTARTEECRLDSGGLSRDQLEVIGHAGSCEALNRASSSRDLRRGTSAPRER
jgi:hypothetical protein